MDGLMSNSKLVVPFSEKDLLCKNECGFYGNPQWQGFCSKCWREYLKQLNQRSTGGTSSNEARTPSPVGEKKWHTFVGPTFSFDKFLEKKNQHTNRRSSTFRSILKKSPSSDNNRPTSPSTSKPKKPPTVQRQLSVESQNAKETFFEFLRQLPGPIAQDVSKQVKLVVDRILKHTEVIPIDELSEIVHDLYQQLADRLRTSLLVNVKGAADPPHTLEDILNAVEQYICSRCYSVLFCPSTDEEVGDLSLQDRIRSLNWVTCGFLDSGFAFDNNVVRDRLDQAVTEIIDMNSRRGPQEKLNSVLQCSKMLFEALKESRSGQPASADEFLPALIYVILKSNPPLLQSNINFVARFALPSKLMSGEAGYYFTNLCCALNFVQNLNADSLKMPKEEFEAYTSGELIPPLNDATCRCQQALKQMEKTLEDFRQLRAKADEVSAKLDATMEKRLSELDKLVEDARAFNEKYPAPKCLDDWLESSPEKERMLPMPLLPSVIKADDGTISGL